MSHFQRFSHIGICVSDLERSIRFYRDGLGFQIEHELTAAGEQCDALLRLRGVKLDATYLTRDGVRIELLHYASPPAPPRPHRAMNEYGLTHLSLRVSDLDGALEGLRAVNATVLEDTLIRYPAYQSVCCFITDPDGQLIELVQMPGDPAKAPGAG